MPQPVSEQRMQQIFESVKSWGRWGKEDQAGALNLITPAKRRAAAQLVRTGEVVSLAREFPVTPSAENPNPALHMMVVGGDSCGPSLTTRLCGWHDAPARTHFAIASRS